MSNSASVFKARKTFEITGPVLLLLKGYQLGVSPLLHQLLGIKTSCRFSPSCSEYAKTVIMQHGILKGLLLAARRLSNCQPFFKI